MEEILKRLEELEKLTLLGAKDVLTLDDVAMLTGLSKSYLYQLTCARQIPYYRPNGKQIYFDKLELQAWMKRNRVNSVEEDKQKALAYMVGKEVGGK